MLVLGLILLLIGLVAGIHILYVVGGILLVIGLILLLLGTAGNGVGGRTWWW